MKDDRFYALELLLAAKHIVKDASSVITETSTPLVREALLKQLNEMVHLHAKTFHYAHDKGIFPSYKRDLLIQMDIHQGFKAVHSSIDTTQV
ncbi:spore coat protein CotH [Aquibacillus halophilus]|uniref:Spore coat protein CotH n=1 Tax=Aquibacillus halophilus TaxID=930132 RepID=A0A6A8DJ06_9BACI|nr:spore coat protein [Aquibacillus halophilus]MRH44446.1 spore coat protein CotH [Aquibacillus halophilus]